MNALLSTHDQILMFLFFIPLYFMIYFNWLLPLDAIRFLTFQVKNMRKSKPPSGPLGLKDNEKKKFKLKIPMKKKDRLAFFFCWCCMSCARPFSLREELGNKSRDVARSVGQWPSVWPRVRLPVSEWKQTNSQCLSKSAFFFETTKTILDGPCLSVWSSG